MITAPKGFRAAATTCGLKVSGKLDLGLLVADELVPAAACFTTNKVQAAPVQVSREHLKSGMARGIIVNSGVANACTGTQGLTDATDMTRLLGDKIGCASRDVLVCSTGVIGKFLDMNKVTKGVNEAYAKLSDSADAGQGFAQAIMTTDTKMKTAYREFDIDGATIRIAGCAKGSGMIAPNMATMLSFITTDARLSPNELRQHLAQAVGRSFNRVTVDGRMSTNDTVMLLASGKASDQPLGSAWQSPFGENLYELCNELALAVVTDGEGATRVFHVMVTGGRSATQVHKIARTIAEDMLVKTAVHGGDPNWGRLICAAGSAGTDFNPNTAVCSIGTDVIFKNGMPVPYNTESVTATMTSKDIWITLELNEGDASDVVHTCDLSKEYVDINAFYHT